MGLISRKVLPVCGSLCVFCPALRSRSRQPVKRYKKLIADVFQEVLPNDRKISKLCDYASKNPLRVPKIAKMLEQRGYKALRVGHYGIIGILVAVYIRLFSVCKVQMPLFALSAVDIIRALLEDHQDEVRVFGCTLLFEFAYKQVDGTYIYQLDALLPKLCSLAKEAGEERRQKQLRSAGLRALSALIWFMGEHLHIPSEYNSVVSVIMDNYGHPFVSSDDSASAIEIPSLWAQLCVEKISQFCKEATTTRRYLEPMFLYFDFGNHWSPRQGLALTVLQQILHFVETFGNDCPLVAVLVRHLDRKSVSRNPQIKADIISIATSLVRQSNSKATTVEIGVLSDMLRQLRNTLVASVDASSQPMLGDYTCFQLAIQNFLSELVKKIGVLAPIFDMMALTLETLPSAPQFSQSTVHSLLILGSIMASQPLFIPPQRYFPEALLQQLSLAMVHPDGDTRLVAQQVFETILSLQPIPEDRRDSFAMPDETSMPEARLNHKFEIAVIRLTEEQVKLVFSSLWKGSKLDSNMPRNYQAYFSTFTSTLQLSSARTSKEVFVWTIQLSLSLRTISTQVNGDLSPSRKRSLFMLSSAMLVFASEFYNITGLAEQVKALCERIQVDPYLKILGYELRVMDEVDASNFGSPADNAAALQFLEKIRKEVDESNEAFVSLIVSSSFMISEDLVRLRNDLLQTFSPITSDFALDSDIDSKKARPWIALLHKSSSFEEIVDSKDDYLSDNVCADLPKCFTDNFIHKPSADIIGVTQLLKSALEMAGQVARTKATVAPLPFSAVAMKCEDFGSTARRKMPIWTNIDECNQTLPLMSADHCELSKVKAASEKGDSYGVDFPCHWKPDQIPNHKPCQVLQLPPVSHYDNFLRAAGC